MSAAQFNYNNLTGRPTGPFLRSMGMVLPGVRAVQQEVAPYAEAWRKANVVALKQTDPLWVVIGDSMALGIGASAYNRGWVGQLAESDAARGYRLVNLAASGARVDDVLSGQLPAMDLLGAKPDLVTVMIGANDMFSRRNRRELLSRYETMLNRLPTGTVVANLSNPSELVAEINSLIDQAVTDRGFVLANMRTSLTSSWRGKLAADHFHPNDRGYTGIASVFGQAIHESAR